MPTKEPHMVSRRFVCGLMAIQFFLLLVSFIVAPIATETHISATAASVSGLVFFLVLNILLTAFVSMALFKREAPEVQVNSH